jgi:hypothetical protein
MDCAGFGKGASRHACGRQVLLANLPERIWQAEETGSWWVAAYDRSRKNPNNAI